MIPAEKIKALSEQNKDRVAAEMYKTWIDKTEKAIELAATNGRHEASIFIHDLIDDEQFCKELESNGYTAVCIRDVVGPTKRCEIKISWT